MSENNSNKKIAIVLFNLGGPDRTSSIKPFLFNLFNDKYIITLPSILRKIVAWLISVSRYNTAKEIYNLIGGKSPILENTMMQRQELKRLLKDRLNQDFDVFVSMRHWYPTADQTVMNFLVYKPTEIILLPLYPQFSTTTTLSAVEDFKRALAEVNLAEIPLKTICCYSGEENFINAHSSLIKRSIENKNNYRILFSAHGLPMRIIEAGDPYQWQVTNTVSKIVSMLNISDLDYKITYQSRVGPLKWLGPSTEEEIKRAGEEGKGVIIVPVAFVSEHVETLVELDIEYKKIADGYSIDYIRVPALGINEEFMEGLANLIIKFSKDNNVITASNNLSRICPEKFTKCICKA